MSKNEFVQRYVIALAGRTDGSMDDDILTAELAVEELESKGYTFA